MNIIKFAFAISLLTVFSFAQENILTKEQRDYLENNQPIKLHNEKNWPPYNFYENGEAKGFSIDYMRLLAKKVDMEIEFVSGYSWDEFMTMLQNKEIDSIINISKNKERSKIFNFTDIFHTAANAIYVQNGKENLNSLKELEGKTIVMPKGFFAQKLIAEHYPKINQILVQDSLEALKILSLGKADATIGKKNVLDYIISTNNISGVKAVNYVDDNRLVSLIRMATNKDNVILKDILQKGQQAISDEELLTLKRKWFGTDSTLNQEKKVSNDFLTSTQKKYLEKNSVFNVCSFKEIRPVEFKKDKKQDGITVDFLDLIANKLGIKINHINSYTVENSKALMSQNQCDVVTTYYKGIEFIDIANLSKPLYTQPLAIVTRKSEPIVKNLEELANKSIAISKNSSIAKIITSNYPNVKIIETSSNYESLAFINSGKAYFALEPLPVALYYMNQHALNDIYISRYSTLDFSAILAVNDNKKELLDIINKTIDNITDKERKEIINKWTNVSFRESINKELIIQITFGFIILVIALVYRQIILHKHNKKLKEANTKIEEKSEEIEKQKKLFENLYYKSADAVLIIKDEKIIDCNEATKNILKHNKNELFGKKLTFLSESSEYFIKDKILKAQKNNNTTFEWFIKDSQNENWLEVVFTSIEIDDYPVIHAVFRDINKRKSLESQIDQLNKNLEERVKEEINKNKETTSKLIHQSRLAQMGEMLSMIAHQWRQPLTAIAATTNNLILKNMIAHPVDSKELDKELNLITDYSQHLSSTINDFRNFFKADKEKVKTNMEELVEKSLNIINTSIQSNEIEVIKIYNSGKDLSTYSNEIQQVILNILKNAEDVLLERNIENKKIYIETKNEDNYAILTINDNSGGISEKIIDKIFDPYFSTKKNQEGTGLGLYMSKTIINEHCEGKLEVSNNTLGAIFTIKLKMD